EAHPCFYFQKVDYCIGLITGPPQQGWINERAYRAQAQGPPELRGPLSQSLCVKSLLCISYLWLKKVYFVHLLMALIECTCAVLENVHVRNYRQCSQCGRFVGKADTVFKMFSNIWMSKRPNSMRQLSSVPLWS